MNKFNWIKLALLIGCLTVVLNFKSTVDCQKFVPFKSENNQLQYLSPNVSIVADEDVETIPDAPPKKKNVTVRVQIKAVDDKTDEVATKTGTVITQTGPVVTTIVNDGKTTTNMPETNATDKTNSASKITISYATIVSIVLSIIYLS